MALLITKENRPIFLPAATARLLWLVHTGERKGTKETRAKAAKISKWYLNRADAPQSYIDTHPPIITEPRKRKLVAQGRLPYID
jgi:hypothetical protein